MLKEYTMKILLILALSIASLQAVSFSDLVQEQWETFKLTHHKHYDNPSEEQYRMRLFMENARNITKHNQLYQKGKVTFKMKLNQWGDLSLDEYRRVTSCLKRSKDQRNQGIPHIYPAHVKIPDEVDWRKEGAVTDVKNQGRCGSCWAFSSTGTLEGQNFRKTGKLVSLSEQNLVDCVKDNGCDGGYTQDALQYVADNQGIDTEEAYPYEQVDGECRYDPNNSGATCRGYTNVAYRDENELKTAVVTEGPISVAIDASQISFQFYSEGVYYEPDCSSDFLDHAVLAVGYGTDENGQDYWLVKNSWGAGWGDQGYIKMARNKNNNCGIATEARFPVM